jgi:hypothetical protein
MLNADTLKSALKGDFQSLFDDATKDNGLAPADYADRLAGIIASCVVSHITDNAEVKITGGQSMSVPGTGTALANGGGPVAGTIATPTPEWAGIVE